MDDQISRKTTKSFFPDEEIENLITVPPDGGWGWFVVFVCFTCNLISDGIVYSFGVFLEDLSNSYQVTVGQMTIVGSVLSCFYYLTGPFVSALLNRFGFRCVGIVGSVIALSGFGFSTLCKTFPGFVGVAGIVTGVGLGMITINGIVAVGFYFEKWRAIAIGMATCGSGIGTLVTPPLANILLDNLGWEKTYLIFASLFFLTGLLSLAYRPLIPIKAKQNETEIKTVNQMESISSIEIESDKCCKCPCQYQHHNLFYPTTAEIVPIEMVVLEQVGLSYDDESTTSFQTYATSLGTPYPSVTATQVTALRPARSSLQSRYSRIRMRRKCWHSPCCRTMSRPMYRDDIFFGHSLMLLPQYKDSIAQQSKQSHTHRQKSQTQALPRAVGLPMPNSTGYHMSVTRVTTLREIHLSETTKKCSCPLAVKRTLATMLDFRLLRSPAFQLFSWSGVFIVFGYMIPFFYIKDRAVESGTSPDIAVWLLSAIGASNTVGRIISGILPSVTKIKVIEYSYICISITGLSTIISGFFMDTAYQFTYACVYGLAGSCIATLRPIIVVELFGLENLTNAYGLQLMFMSVAALVGTIVGGMIYDVTKVYNYAFYLSGGCLLTSAVLLTFIRVVRRNEKINTSNAILR